MGKEYSSSFKRSIPGLRFLVSRVAPRVLYETKLHPEVNKQIKETKKFLRKNPRWNLIVIQNHFTENDALYGGYIASRIDPFKRRHAFGPTAAVHSEKKKGKKGSKKVILNEVIRRCGVELFPVVQSYQRNNPEKYGFTGEEVVKKDKYFVRGLGRLKKSKKRLTCIIMPEGHRSDDGKLGKGERGIETIVRKLSPARIISLGVSSPEEVERDGLNFRKRFDLDVGDIVDCNIGEKVNVDDLMRNLAKAVPPEMRGEYGEESNS